MRKKLIAGMMAACLIFTPACSPNTETEVPEIIEKEERPVRAQDDFYGYVNKDILLNAKVDYKYGTYSDTQMSAKKTDEILNEIINEIVESDKEYEEGTCEWSVKMFYKQAMDYITDDSIKASHREEIENVLDNIANAGSVKELTKYVVSNTGSYGLSQLFRIQPDSNVYNSSETSLYISTFDNVMGISCEEINEDKDMAFGVQRLSGVALRALGYDEDYVMEESRKVALLSVNIANNMDYEIYNTNDPIQYMEFIPKSELQKIFAEADYAAIESALGIEDEEYEGLYTYNGKAVRYLGQVLTEQNLEELKVIELYWVLVNYSDELEGGKTDVSKIIEKDMRPAEKQAVMMVKAALGSELSYLYTNKVYTDKMENDVQEMVADIQNEYKNVISSADWLTKETRDKLIQKLENMQLLTPDYERKRENKSEMRVGRDYFETCRFYTEDEWNKTFESFGEKYDKLIPGMNMQTVNACYSSNNVITLTAAILQGAVYCENAEYTKNLGGLGVTLAHEIGHAFDDSGMKYDENGNYNPDNICKEDWEALEEKNRKAIDYFETSFTVFGVYHVNGEKSLGENFADLSAVEVCLNICKNDEDKRKLLEAYALSWGTLSDAKNTIERMMSDPHSPETIRVNAVIATCDDFYSLYDVKEGDGMYIAPEKRISRWY